MIFTWLIRGLLTALNLIFPSTLPSFNQGIIDILNNIFLYMGQGLNFLSCFLDMNVVLILLPIVLALIAFRYVYQFTVHFLHLFHLLR